MEPLAVLDRVIHCLDRGFAEGHRVQAFVKARAALAQLELDEIASRARAGTLTELAGVGPVTAKLVTESFDDEIPSYLAKLEVETRLDPSTSESAALRTALKGDCHTHSTWSDGGAEIEAMAAAARAIGHDYLVLTDHSARLKVARGLSRERLERQLDVVAAINDDLAPFRILTGIEVDILADGTLDCADDLLARLDLVVASVHSKMSMERRAMTERMVLAVANPHVDVLGHCTNRKVAGGSRPESQFDAEIVFMACKQFDTAVEINCRPERLDPPRRLLRIAAEFGCRFAIDSDAHATGQLEWQPYGCDRAGEIGIEADRIVNTWPVDELLGWTASHS